jgi:hypothetical protein
MKHEHCATGGHLKLVLFNFVQLVMTGSQNCKVVVPHYIECNSCWLYGMVKVIYIMYSNILARAFCSVQYGVRMKRNFEVMSHEFNFDKIISKNTVVILLLLLLLLPPPLHL